MKRDLATLVGATFLLWAMIAYPMWRLEHDAEVVFTAVAALLCVLPTAGNLAWAHWAARQAPEQRIVMVLGGTGLRMLFVMLAGFALYTRVPYFADKSFWIWVLVFYLGTLALEVLLIVRLVAREERGTPIP